MRPEAGGEAAFGPAARTALVLGALAVGSLWQPARAMEAGDWSLDLNGLSWHSERHYVDDGVAREYNETNPGLGASYAWHDDFDLKLGFFENSYYRDTVYAGVYWHRDFYWGDWTLAPGVALLLVTGYDDTPRDAPVVAPLAIPGVSFGHRAVRLNLGFMPVGSVQFAVAQLQLVPAQW